MKKIFTKISLVLFLCTSWIQATPTLKEKTKAFLGGCVDLDASDREPLKSWHHYGKFTAVTTQAVFASYSIGSASKNNDPIPLCLYIGATLLYQQLCALVKTMRQSDNSKQAIRQVQYLIMQSAFLSAALGEVNRKNSTLPLFFYLGYDLLLTNAFETIISFQKPLEDLKSWFRSK